MNARAKSYARFLALFMFICALIAFLIASRLQTLISRPILPLGRHPVPRRLDQEELRGARVEVL